MSTASDPSTTRRNATEPAATPSGDPWLLTPGPLTTSLTVKQAMLHDLGSRDPAFVAVNTRIRERLVAMAGGEGSHECVPLQGSGTFVVEAMLATFVPPAGKLLILANGAYGQRMARMCAVMGRDHRVVETAEDTPVDPQALDRCLGEDPGITHVAVVYCETTSGVLNPLAEVARVTARHGRALLVDAMSAFGALPLDAAEVPFDAMAASSNKCLEGVPGVGFCIARGEALAASAGHAHSLSLDLHDQWQAMQGNGQWRFTPPVHCLLALDQALEEHAQEGGVAGRGARYAHNCRILVEGMQALGFQPLLPAALQAPIIVTFRMPADPAFDFPRFYGLMSERGFVIYPGKLTVAESFRIGCIGRLGEGCMQAALQAVREAMAELGVRSGAPAP
jgi:2-aminoethylphosphonate-pyruvate transaminase